MIALPFYFANPKNTNTRNNKNRIPLRVVEIIPIANPAVPSPVPPIFFCLKLATIENIARGKPKYGIKKIRRLIIDVVRLAIPHPVLCLVICSSTF